MATITLRQSEIEAMLRDPVLATWVFFGIELDTFQGAIMRLLWFTPEVIDSSAISTGKTMRAVIWACLRAILLPNPANWKVPGRRIGVFYQSSGNAEAVFKKEMDQLTEYPGARMFRRELRPMHGGRLGFRDAKGVLTWTFRNGGFIACPPTDLMKKGQTLAGQRYHDGLIDEFPEFDAKGDAIDEQILGRINEQPYNPRHPVWCNHRLLMGHAQDPDSHPSYKRIRAFRELIRGGSQSHALVTSNPYDWTDKRETFINRRSTAMAEIRRDKLVIGRARIDQKWGGAWVAGSEDWYDAQIRQRCLSHVVRPEVAAETPRALYAMGWDTASGESRRSDWNAAGIWRAVEVREKDLGRLGVMPLDNGTYWHLAPVAAVAVQSRDSVQCAGIIHGLHARFGFSRIVLDPGGGGKDVKKQLWKPQQLVEAVPRKVTGLCEWGREDEFPEALPIVCEFTPLSPRLLHVWDEGFGNSNDGILENMHRKMRDAWETRTIAWPMPLDMRPAASLRDWEQERLRFGRTLDEAFQQFGQIKVLVDRDGTPRLTANGRHRFAARKGKKDIAYAILYGFIAILSLVTDPEGMNAGEADSEAVYG